MKKIIMTGGGTSGHVTPNIALFSELKRMNYEIHYIGTKNGIEKKLVEDTGVQYHSIYAGKLRRYFDLKNMSDALRVLRGFGDALLLIRKIKPDVVFSKGGFVSTPVVWASYLNKVPAVIHESDYTPGLANRLAMPFAKKICYTFPETQQYITKEKAVLTGIPVREELFSGKASEGKKISGFTDSKPIIVMIGGSQGSKVLNIVLRESLPSILEIFNVCHICGEGGIDLSYNNTKGYKQFEYVNKELPHIFSMADIVISRAGATTIFELLALRKPSLLIPLSKQASRGDQILNANSFEKHGFSRVLMEENLSTETFIQNVLNIYKERDNLIKAMEKSLFNNGMDKVLKVIREL